MASPRWSPDQHRQRSWPCRSVCIVTDARWSSWSGAGQCHRRPGPRRSAGPVISSRSSSRRVRASTSSMRQWWTGRRHSARRSSVIAESVKNSSFSIGERTVWTTAERRPIFQIARPVGKRLEHLAVRGRTGRTARPSPGSPRRVGAAAPGSRCRRAARRRSSRRRCRRRAGRTGRGAGGRPARSTRRSCGPACTTTASSRRRGRTAAHASSMTCSFWRPGRRIASPSHHDAASMTSGEDLGVGVDGGEVEHHAGAVDPVDGDVGRPVEHAAHRPVAQLVQRELDVGHRLGQLQRRQPGDAQQLRVRGRPSRR